MGMIIMVLIYLFTQSLASWLNARRRSRLERDAIDKLEKDGYRCLMPSNTLEHFENLDIEQRLYIGHFVIIDKNGDTITRFVELTHDTDSRAQSRRANFALIQGGKK
ncbi:hypothetical protein [Marinobacterium sp. BA1]|uniref:hypothetical protein n=1 Tax=Marinobacterium sp. BA1 TaxID=3138931 RepID=UPI0034E8E038